MKHQKPPYKISVSVLTSKVKKHPNPFIIEPDRHTPTHLWARDLQHAAIRELPGSNITHKHSAFTTSSRLLLILLSKLTQVLFFECIMVTIKIIEAISRDHSLPCVDLCCRYVWHSWGRDMASHVCWEGGTSHRGISICLMLWLFLCHSSIFIVLCHCCSCVMFSVTAVIGSKKNRNCVAIDCPRPH